MFSKRKDKDSSDLVKNGSTSISSVIAEDISITGKLTGESGLRIEGKFEGDINLNGLLVIGENAIVTSKKISATRLIIAGQVHGVLRAETVEIRSTGKVWGDIDAENFSIEEGAFLHGQVNMKETPTSE